MPKQIQVGAITQALQRAFGFKGKYIPMLDEVIVPVWVVQDATPAAVARIVGATRNEQATLVGEFAHVWLWNPPGSGVIGSISNVAIQLTDDADIQLTKPFSVVAKIAVTDTKPGTALVGVTQGTFRDTRQPRAPSNLQMLSEEDLNSTAGGDNLASLLWPAGVAGSIVQTMNAESADPRQPLVVLKPGSYLELSTSPAVNGAGENVKMRVNFFWIEVPITEQDPAGGLPGT